MCTSGVSASASTAPCRLASRSPTLLPSDITAGRIGRISPVNVSGSMMCGFGRLSHLGSGGSSGLTSSNATAIGASGLWTVTSTQGTGCSARQMSASRCASVSIRSTGSAGQRRAAAARPARRSARSRRVVAGGSRAGVEPELDVDDELLTVATLVLEDAVMPDAAQPAHRQPVVDCCRVGHRALPSWCRVRPGSTVPVRRDGSTTASPATCSRKTLVAAAFPPANTPTGVSSPAADSTFSVQVTDARSPATLACDVGEEELDVRRLRPSAPSTSASLRRRPRIGLGAGVHADDAVVRRPRPPASRRSRRARTRRRRRRGRRAPRRTSASLPAQSRGSPPGPSRRATATASRERAHVVDPHAPGPAPAASTESAAVASSRSTAGARLPVVVGEQRAEEGLAGRPDQHGQPSSSSSSRRPQQRPVVLGGLGEAEPRVEGQPRRVDPRGHAPPRPARRARRRPRPPRRRTGAAPASRVEWPRQCMQMYGHAQRRPTSRSISGSASPPETSLTTAGARRDRPLRRPRRASCRR